MPKCRLCNNNVIDKNELHIICHKSDNHSIWCTECIQDIIKKTENKSNIILTCQLCNSENVLNYEIESNLEKSFSYEYNNGNLHGENVKIYYENEVGVKSIGNYDKGKLYGKYIEYEEDGNILMTCTYENGFINGIYTEYRCGEIYSDTIYENGLKNGVKKYYYKNNDIIQMDMYKDDMLNGMSIIYNVENGKKVLETNYKNNIKDGICIEYIYDENGNLINQNGIEYKDDKIYNGIENIYYGCNKKQVKSRVNYVNGMKEGLYKEVGEDGKIKYEKYYEKDVLNGICKSYDINGNIILEENYINGLLNGKVIKNIYKENIKNIFIYGVKKEEKKIYNKSYSYEELLKNDDSHYYSIESKSPTRVVSQVDTKKEKVTQIFRINQFSDFGSVEEEDKTPKLEDQFENNMEENKNMMNDEDPFIRKIKEFTFM